MPHRTFFIRSQYGIWSERAPGSQEEPGARIVSHLIAPFTNHPLGGEPDSPLTTHTCMRPRLSLLVFLLLFAAPRSGAQIRNVAELNTEQIRALDRAKTVVLLPGGMMEEHGPYLPAFTDGILSARLTQAIANGVVARKPGWTVLVFPQVSVGASGSNEIGRQFRFAGTYAVRPSTLRAMYMDLATELGEQGFRWIMVVHVHGSPLHIGALDEAGDFFHETYGGTMVNLWGLLPVLAGWGNAMSIMTAEQKRDDGVSLHGGADEHSMMLYLAPKLVSPGFRTASSVSGANYEESFAVAQNPGWPGYIGAPKHASAALGKHIWDGFSAAAVKTTVDILNGADPAAIPRYLSFLVKNPLYQGWIESARAQDSAGAERQRAWRARRPPPK